MTSRTTGLLVGGGLGALALMGLAAASAGGSKAALRGPSTSGSGGEPGDDVPFPPVPLPVTINSPYGMRMHPTLHVERMHDGIDLGVPSGTPVSAPDDGAVVQIEHAQVDTERYPSGNAVHVAIGPYRWIFMHLSRVDVQPNAVVARGQRLGLSGATGRVSGPHVHLKILGANGRTLDPETMFPTGTFRHKGDPAPTLVATSSGTPDLGLL